MTPPWLVVTDDDEAELPSCSIDLYGQQRLLLHHETVAVAMNNVSVGGRQDPVRHYVYQCCSSCDSCQLLRLVALTAWLYAVESGNTRLDPSYNVGSRFSSY